MGKKLKQASTGKRQKGGKAGDRRKGQKESRVGNLNRADQHRESKAERRDRLHEQACPPPDQAVLHEEDSETMLSVTAHTERVDADQPMEDVCFTRTASSASAPSLYFHHRRLSRTVLHVTVSSVEDGTPLLWRDALNLHEDCDNGFEEELCRALCSCPFDDFYWECSPVSSQTVSSPFEFVLIDARAALRRRRVCPTDFSKHLSNARGQFCTAFPNLGRDAMLVVPTQQPRTHQSVYGDLASFVRGAAQAQIGALWHQVRLTTLEALKGFPDVPVWLSTDGNGVPWLHVRLDFQPKYIKHRPYARVRMHEHPGPRSTQKLQTKAAPHDATSNGTARNMPNSRKSHKRRKNVLVDAACEAAREGPPTAAAALTGGTGDTQLGQQTYAQAVKMQDASEAQWKGSTPKAQAGAVNTIAITSI